MKKLIAISILLAIVSTAAYAELEISFDATIYTDLMYFTKLSGSKDDGSNKSEPWDNVNGSFNFLSSTHTFIPGDNLSLTFTHTGEYHEASVMLLTEDILRRAGKLSDTTWLEMLDGGVGDWYIRGEAGSFDGFVGNIGYGGLVNTYGVFNNYLKPRGLRLNDFGVYTTKKFQLSDNMAAFGDDVLALGATFGDFKFALGSSLDTEGWNLPQASASSVNAAFMLSGGELVDGLLNFDLFYGIKGEDNQTNDRDSGGSWNNVFGVYAGLNLMDGDLGLSIGYTGNVKIDEKGQGEGKSDTTTDAHPLFSGISIHLDFTGIEDVGITFNNNISFTGATGIEDKEKTIYGPLGGALAKDKKENWFAWHSAIKFGYDFSEDFNLNLQLANLLKTTSDELKDNKGSGSLNNFRAVLMADYNVGFVSVGAGLSMDILSLTSNREIGSTKSTDKYNVFTFGVPIYFQLSF